MSLLLRHLRTIIALVLLSSIPATAHAQQSSSLRTATIAAGSAAAADWASTYHALKYYRVREANPLLRPFDRTPGQMVMIGAAIDVTLVSAWRLGMDRNHPRLSASGLWAMTAFRTYLAVHNLRNENRAARR